METPTHPNHLTGNEGEEFDLETSARWTKSHRDKNPHEPVSHFFGKEILQKILNQEGCMGIRIYHAYSEDDKKHVILTGATSDGKDMIHQTTEAASPLAGDDVKTATAPVKYTVAQQGMPCPGSPGCPSNIIAGENN